MDHCRRFSVEVLDTIVAHSASIGKEDDDSDGGRTSTTTIVLSRLDCWLVDAIKIENGKSK